jgi:hypothetical protein
VLLSIGIIKEHLKLYQADGSKLVLSEYGEDGEPRSCKFYDKEGKFVTIEHSK